ncbi:TIGR02391 family protein [Zoogloea dura]|jgi:uncharacterized protein (TIGR02391 family)|uniref:TIGR02391 family protein n=1 Tax=Zoogloea dura TaxID=2728840 RepID=A0A848GEW5_9RHOO|nr:TIGR02391 family protein [Zoogloea dura]NML28943.1 TIGR02391 family protein [Zoogloea dura]
MATKKPPAATPRPANLTPIQMSQALPRLEKRLKELDAFTASGSKDEVSAAAKALQQKYDDTLIEIFGNDTLEYQRFHIGSFYEGSGVIAMASFGAPRRSLAEEVEPYKKGVAKAARTLRTIIELFTEKLEEAGASTANPVRTLESLDLHPQIADASVDLFKGGHYANAIEDACKVLDLLVKMKSKRTDPSGTELMQLVFSPKKPALKFNDQLNDSEKSEQQGMMFLYAGAMLAFRNPRAHGLLSDDPVIALEIIGFVNFLAKALDRTRRA